MKKALVVGCSYTRGHGLELEQEDPQLWVNVLLKSVGIEQIDNFADTGANNDWIFHKTVASLIKNEYDLVIVGWSAIPRYNFYVGLELYRTRTMLKNLDINCNTKTFKGKWFEKLYNDLIQMHNDHWDYVKLIQYVNTLIELQISRNKKIFFVNSLLPFPKNYFVRKDITLPSDLTEYEQQLLSVETRDDEEIFNLYDMIHNHYAENNGIRENFWLNLYKSLRTLQVDTISQDDQHPGYASQEKFAKYLISALNEKLETV